MKRPDYRVIPETDRIGAAYSAADLVLARAGSSVFELAAAGKPAILVPYPFATGDHQARNARALRPRGRRDHGARPRRSRTCPTTCARCSATRPRLEQMGAAMLRAAKPNAADEIAEGLIELATA